MTDTSQDVVAASGRFVLRLPPALHASLRAEAERSGLSLNEYCLRALAAPGPDPAGPGAAVAARALERFGDDVVGVVLFGSWVRGEATAASDIDALVVLEPRCAVTRALYRDWDEAPLRHQGHEVEVHFVSMPGPDDAPGPIWLEVALDGAVVSDRDGRLARHMAGLRRAIANGDVTRRHAHGQPYWTVAG